MKAHATGWRLSIGRLAKGFCNLLSIDIGWAACIMGASHGYHWLGLIVVPILFIIHITLIETQKIRTVFTVALITMGIGFFADTLLVVLGTVEPKRWIMPPPFIPLWDLMIWANFSLALDVSLRYLQKKPFAAAILGAVLAPGTYFAGDRLGALHFAEPIALNLVWVGMVWFFVMPGLSLMSRYYYHRQNDDDGGCR
ncbi:MAG: DUF2878 domain-containing protein [Sedimentisphaerales bacterium]|nr:DUF2878 domain-containing protein [Sedimentisphaerales bacterium]